MATSFSSDMTLSFLVFQRDGLSIHSTTLNLQPRTLNPRQGAMSEAPLPVPFEDGDFFPEQAPPDHPQYHSWKRDREASRLAAIGHSPDEIAEMLKLNDRRTGLPDPRRAIAAIRRG